MNVLVICSYNIFIITKYLINSVRLKLGNLYCNKLTYSYQNDKISSLASFRTSETFLI